MEEIYITDWIQQRINEVDNTIESYNKYYRSMSEIVNSFNNSKDFFSPDSLNDVTETQKEVAEARLSIYRNVIKDILIPTKNNYLHLLKSFDDESSI